MEIHSMNKESISNRCMETWSIFRQILIKNKKLQVAIYVLKDFHLSFSVYWWCLDAGAKRGFFRWRKRQIKIGKNKSEATGNWRSNHVAKIKMTYFPRVLGSGRGGGVIKLSWFKIWPLDSIASIKLITMMFWNTRTQCRNESGLKVSARLTGDGVWHVKFRALKTGALLWGFSGLIPSTDWPTRAVRCNQSLKWEGKKQKKQQ